MIVPEGARNIEFVGHTDQGGRGDGVQVMVARGHAYIGTRVRRGVMVTDVRDPRNPKPVNFVAMHPNSVSMHLQAADDLLLCIQEADQRALLTQQEYYGGSGKVDSSRFGKRGEDYAAGMRVYDISDPANPRQIGSMEVPGLGLHRIWWVGGRYAYASALLDGYTDHILMVIDMADPTKPQEVGRWWIPGMNAAAGETPTWTDRYALHHAIVADDFAYGSWRDGGLTILDVKDKTAPKLIAHRNWCPPFGGGTHNAVPLHDRDLLVVADEAVLNIDQEPAQAHLDVRHPREEQPGQHRDDADAGRPGLREDGRPVRSAQSAREPPRIRSRAARRSSPPGRAPACACSTSPTRIVRRRSAISCRRSRRNGRSRCAAARRSGTRPTCSSRRTD